MTTNETTDTDAHEEDEQTSEQPDTPTVDGDDTTVGPDTSRRSFLKGIGTTAAVAAGGGTAMTGTVTADHTDASTWLHGAAMGPIGIAYVVGKSKAEHATGPDRDLSGYTGGDALHAAQEEDVLELRSREQEVLTEVRNIIERGEVAATMDGKKAFIRAYNAGDTKSECQTAAENAVDDFWSNRQQSIVSRWDQAVRMIRRRLTEGESNSDFNQTSIWSLFEGGYDQNNATEDSVVSDYFRTKTDSADNRAEFECFNGDLVPYTYYNRGGTSDQDRIDPFGAGIGVYEGFFEFTDTNGSPMIVLSTQKYIQIMDRITTARDRTVGNMATYVDESFSALERGEITTDDLLNHYDIQQEFATNKDTTGYHGWLAWEFYALGFESDLQHNAVLSFPESENTSQLKGTLFVSDAEPIGGKIEVGKTYDPTQWGGESAYFTYERVETDSSNVQEHEQTVKEHDDGSVTVIGKIQIKEKFTVEKLFNVQSGETVDSTTTEETNDQNYDPSKLQAEIDRLNEKITQMQENAEASESGNGGGGSEGGPSMPDVKWWQGGIVGAALLGALYALSAGGDNGPPRRR